MANGHAAVMGGNAGRPTESKAVQWIRANLFSSWWNTALSLVLLYLLGKFLFWFVGWGVTNAIWYGAATECRAVKGIGACWAVFPEKWRFILFATYPYEDQWRPALSCLIFFFLYAYSALRRNWNTRLPAVWIGGLLAIAVLMWGGILGLAFVPQERWGGLVLTLILSTFGIALAFPLAILLALGRRSHMPAIKSLCVVYIELIRGVPLISLLFMASVMFPLFLPEGITIDKLLRAQIAIIGFAGAYLAEVVRGGLQALPKGQYEAADALGLSYWQATRMIILPQALRLVIPPMVNTFIGLFKDTSLVLIIGLLDILNAAKTAVSDPAWRGFGPDVYFGVSLIYFVFCFAMSKYSQRIEGELNKSKHR
ncbi:MAG: amino acid ABC transporter permease [Rhodospirillales bacterium]|nr:amino acid ABC transporter permease [Rhodospirillales bacterium]